MIRTTLLTLAALTLTACNQSAKIEQEIATAEKGGANSDYLCDAKRRLARAYAEEGNAKEFQWANSRADVACIMRDLDRGL